MENTIFVTLPKNAEKKLALRDMQIGGIGVRKSGEVVMRIWNNNEIYGKLLKLSDGNTWFDSSLDLEMQEIYPIGTKIQIEMGR